MSNDKITKILNLRPIEEAKENEIVVIENVKDVENLPAEMSTENDETINDIEQARGNIKNIIEKGDDALAEMIELAKQSESPRAFEVASTLMKTLLDANKDFVEMSTKKKYAKEELKGPVEKQQNITNNNLILSTADLLKMMKGTDEN